MQIVKFETKKPLIKSDMQIMPLNEQFSHRWYYRLELVRRYNIF